MLNNKTHKIHSLFIQYFFFYALVVAYFPFTGCFGVRKDLVPQRNEVLGGLPYNIKKLYLELTQMLDDDERKVLETKINTIKDPHRLTYFIEKCIDYKGILKLLPKPERALCKQAFTNAFDINHAEKLIKQYQNELKMIYNASIQTQQYYIDLLQVLPEDQATALKKQIVQSTSPTDVDQLIILYLPNAFKKIDEDTKKELISLPDEKRQEILKKAMEKNEKKHFVDGELDSLSDFDYDSEYDADSNDEKENISITNLIQQKIEEQENKEDEDIPQDKWGKKLKLQGEKREQFVLYTLDLKPGDESKLKELFTKADQEGLDNLADVFFEVFPTDKERKDLLDTMIYLYKGWPKDTLLLCNHPASFGAGKKLQLFWHTNKYQRTLLTKLDNAIEALENSRL
ncbi:MULTISPECIES: hypothetical protein [unclassified Candidatus Cardinium]|uniref:hypothetical protein n=1 Tax=unclassified Candidatus Cardinium TaxID=2641185 RepID=UPI001FB1F209|nr:MULTISPECIES: hypothetical protein [unclassified Candidatus Cardinium]